ncbi:MAG: ABC-type multidrug transport system fused ATPase/permease subunit [Marinomonas primoryensis]|jgi:ABC-type multidrug transport system fused ATPase/permease subunit
MQNTSSKGTPMDQDTLTVLQKLTHSDDFLKATALPIDEAHFIQSEQAKKEWEKSNKSRGLGKFFLIILLACTVIRLLMLNPKPLFDLVPIYIYLTAVVSMVLVYVAILFVALVFGFKVRKSTRRKMLKKHLEDQNLIFLDKLDHFSVTVIRKTKDDIQQAKEGNAESLFNLSESLLNGKILNVNYKMAIAIASVAAELGNSRAALTVAKAFNKERHSDFNDKDDIDNYLDFKEDQNHYILWLQKAASLGSYEATSKLQTLEKEGANSVGECSAASVIKKALGPII